MFNLFSTIGRIVCLLIIILGLMEVVARHIPTGRKLNILTCSKAPKYLPDNWDKYKYEQLRKDAISATSASDDFLGYYFKPYSSKTLNLIEAYDLTKRLTWECETSYKYKLKNVEIYFFGGSTMFGQGVTDFDTIPSFVSKILYEKFNIKANVHNFARQAYVSTEEFLLFSYLAPKIRKKEKTIAVFFSGLNEVVSVNFFVPPNLEKRMGNSIIARIKKQIGSFAHKSSLMNVLGNFIIDNKKVIKVSISDQDELEVEENYKRNALNIISIAKDNNILPLFYWQPLNIFKKVKTLYEQNTDYVPEIEYRKYIDFSYKYFYDISHFFENTSEPIFLDFGHYNEKGNELIAGKIAKDIAERLNES